jgi:two-component system sensor histidine kinase UhpB
VVEVTVSPARQRPPARPRSRRLSRLSLLWRVFAVNALVCVVAFSFLAWAPVTVHRVATSSELAVLSTGLLVMLVVDLLLLRRTLGPLRCLAAMMGKVEPGQPGRRAQTPEGAGHEVAALAGALNEMLDRLEGERRDSARRALAAQEAERKRIARELHDEVGQTLTAIALRAERAASDPASHRQALEEIAEHVQRSLEDVRRMARELRPEALDDLGLVNALIALCSRVDPHDGLRVRRHLEWDLPALSAEVELVLYRVAQEALTNALRHANATEVVVSLTHTPTSVALSVADDGQGLTSRARDGGLAGMRERAMLIHAALDVRSTTGRGTEIVLTVPAIPA